MCRWCDISVFLSCVNALLTKLSLLRPFEQSFIGTWKKRIRLRTGIFWRWRSSVAAGRRTLPMRWWPVLLVQGLLVVAYFFFFLGAEGEDAAIAAAFMVIGVLLG